MSTKNAITPKSVSGNSDAADGVEGGVTSDKFVIGDDGRCKFCGQMDGGTL